MADSRMRIERLVVRMRGIPEPRARGLAAGLGEVVLRQLSSSLVLATRPPTVAQVERVDAGTVTLSSREQIAAHIAGAVAAQVSPVEGD